MGYMRFVVIKELNVSALFGNLTHMRSCVSTALILLKRYFKECTNRGAYILGTGAAFGDIYSTEEMLKAFHCQRKVVGDTEYDKDFADRVFGKCGFNGHSVTLSKEDLFRTMSRDEYVALRRSNLVELARKACEKALQDWGGDRKSITHLFWYVTAATAVVNLNIDEVDN